ncbi:GNAT family N-acetyltransferase [Morganella psychrotolerans]|uniref:GNAT family N-acetyltransferase n=1 Tax=Morganella psychrotolerans TaxID=368603 RepID=A0A5M9RBU4_9GAMM|nr:GNAT family N-acetyltransferase [Morganella psychrotolerans]KAA8717779.1 GNAT family N-acetyltransferase [Morganella psychrotolerans]OBU07985.1 GNAT family acetyltransferase [Morganella psychrotolerans]
MNLQGYLVTERHFWRSIAQSYTDIGEYAQCYLTPLPVPVFNYIYLQAGAGEAELVQAQAVFDNGSKPHCLVVEKTAAKSLNLQIVAGGYEADGETSAMYLNIAQWQPLSVLPQGCEVHEVNEQLTLWATPLEAAFPTDDGADDTPDFSIISDYISYHQRAMEKGTELHHFVLMYNNEPVSCMTLSVLDNMARIDDLGTIPAYQGKGFASLLLDNALTLCRTGGVSDCYLEASSEGLGLYKKHGFRTLFEYCFYIKG